MPAGNGRSNHLDAALRIARKVDAHINALCILPDPGALYAALPEVARQRGVTMAAIERENDDKAVKMHTQFDAWRKRNEVASGPVGSALRGTYACWEQTRGLPEETMIRHSRLSDLIVMGVPNEVAPIETSLRDAALFESGRPLLLVPAWGFRAQPHQPTPTRRRHAPCAAQQHDPCSHDPVSASSMGSRSQNHAEPRAVTADFLQMPRSDAALRHIEAEAAELRANIETGEGCRVQIIRQSCHHAPGEYYHVSIEVDAAQAPTGRAVSQAAHAQLAQAVTMAFAGLKGRLRQRHSSGSNAPPERMLSGHIVHLAADEGTGVIAGDQGGEVGFTAADVPAAEFAALHVGDRVWWIRHEDRPGGRLVQLAHEKNGPHLRSHDRSATSRDG